MICNRISVIRISRDGEKYSYNSERKKKEGGKKTGEAAMKWLLKRIKKKFFCNPGIFFYPMAKYYEYPAGFEKIAL